MQLNNYLQGNGGTKMLNWEVYPSGPSHDVTWTATVFSEIDYVSYASLQSNIYMFIVRGAPYGRSVSSRQNTAMEEAAMVALQTLRSLEAQASQRGRGY